MYKKIVLLFLVYASFIFAMVVADFIAAVAVVRNASSTSVCFCIKRDHILIVKVVQFLRLKTWIDANCANMWMGLIVDIKTFSQEFRLYIFDWLLSSQYFFFLLLSFSLNRSEKAAINYNPVCLRLVFHFFSSHFFKKKKTHKQH